MIEILPTLKIIKNFYYSILKEMIFTLIKIVMNFIGMVSKFPNISIN